LKVREMEHWKTLTFSLFLFIAIGKPITIKNGGSFK
jgi:hypothetical protein